MKRVMVMMVCTVLLAAGCALNTGTITTQPKPILTGYIPPEPVSADNAIPKDKQTVLGLYATSKEAYEQWKANPNSVKILDCRTPEEYIYVGHAAMAYNIPSKFTQYQLNEKKHPVMKDNPNFVEEVKKKFKPSDLIFITCRSGGRSAMSVNKLAEAGFKTVYNITDGFEGDDIKDPGSAYYGKRMRNGWKNSGLPWTYELDPNLAYLPENK